MHDFPEGKHPGTGSVAKSVVGSVAGPTRRPYLDAYLCTCTQRTAQNLRLPSLIPVPRAGRFANFLIIHIFRLEASRNEAIAASIMYAAWARRKKLSRSLGTRTNQRTNT